MKHSKILAPVAVLAILVPACASDESPTDVPGSDDAPISTSSDGFDPNVDDGIDTEVEQGNNAGFEGEEDG